MKKLIVVIILLIFISTIISIVIPSISIVKLYAEIIHDVVNTKHNLSSNGPGTVKSNEDEVCVFCHTPHVAAQTSLLWNRKLSDSNSYTPYTSSSMNAAGGSQNLPSFTSKLCLSCHDGSIAIGNLHFANGVIDGTIPTEGTGTSGEMPAGMGKQTGFTRNLGKKLTNDHPISITYDSTLATNDGEMRNPDIETHIKTRGPNVRPVVPLEYGKVECISCHNPHIRETEPQWNIKFLNLNRFQKAEPQGNTFNETNDIICLACHNKLGNTWADSIHADPAAANEVYKDSAADLREFPRGITVWKAACLNCHDTHTVEGARRLLREGTDAPGGVDTPRNGGKSAIESTCFQCHTNNTKSLLQNTAEVPDIETDFSLPRHMPITNPDQPAGLEKHDIEDANFTEAQLKLGAGDLANRHAECTDCHNPHRIIKNRLFTGTESTVSSTHNHTAPHTNIASGALKGTWGVQPIYTSTSFQDMPLSFDIKKGDSGTGTQVSIDIASAYLTREYQVCLKCHSNYGYTDNNVYPNGTRPTLGSFTGGTPSGTNNLVQYTNQAKEFQAPVTHQGEGTPSDGSPTGSGSGRICPPNPITPCNDSDWITNNHRSWHPVMLETGRTLIIRGMSSNQWLAPFLNIGTQTMYCTDCHGSNTALGTTTPTGTNPWGPHGSTNDFILKGTWSNATGTGGEATDLCFKCHNYNNYATISAVTSGFSGPRSSNLHGYHRDKIGRLRCNWCHVAVPHGWKNKAFLVNLNDVGPEVGLSPGTQVKNNTTTLYNRAPYYMNAALKVLSFAKSGEWVESNCGSQGAPGNGKAGRDWMRDSNENCAAPAGP